MILFYHPQSLPQSRTALYAWKTLLEETEKTAKARVTAAETVSQHVSESIKLQKNHRVQTLKKVGIYTLYNYPFLFIFYFLSFVFD